MKTQSMDQMPVSSIFLKSISGPFQYENKETDTEWGFEIIGKDLVLTFQGSTSQIDWIQNFSFRKTRSPSGSYRGHRGFIEKYKSIREHVQRVIDGILESFRIEKIYVLGYSQGAAVAVVAAEDIPTMFPRFRNTVYGFGFGTPRVISSLTSDTSPWKYFVCFQNNNDIVTKVPFRWMFYQGVGLIMQIGDHERRPLTFKVRDHLQSEYLHSVGKI
jgi:triacylglycerol lipase